MSGTESVPANELGVLSVEPLAASTALPDMKERVTPTKHFFIRNHFAIPEIDVRNWSLSISGQVDKPFSLDYDALLAMPSREVVCLMECAGNSRSTMQPPAEGVQWDHGAVSTASWKGVPVDVVLEGASVRGNAKYVLFDGIDRGSEAYGPSDLTYAMSIPIKKTLHPDTILAYEMNGRALTPEHGYPVRLVAPGWYGMASVKWLGGITVIDRPNAGFHEMDYRIYPATDGEADAKVERVTSLKVKSLISTPTKGDIVSPGLHKIKGVAWSGDGHIAKVEVSTDDDRTWRPAKLEERSGNYSWQHWEIDWVANNLGHSLLRCRATDSQGNVQPMLAQWNFRGYQVNSIHSVPITVRKP